MKAKIAIKAILISLAFALAIVSWSDRLCSKPKQAIQSDTVTVTRKQLVYDTVIRELQGKTTMRYQVIRDTVLQDVDTAAILRDYFALRVFSTEYQDSNIKAQVTDTVAENKLIGTLFTYQITRPTQVIYTTTQVINNHPARPSFYAGIAAGYPLNVQVQGFYAGKKIGLSLGNTLTQPQPNFTAGVLLPIKSNHGKASKN